MVNIEKSYKFKNIEVNLIKLVEMIVSNNNVKKYIYYLKDNPIAEPEVDVNLLETGHIVLTPFDENILDEKRVTMFVNPTEGNLRKQPLSRLIYLIEIAIPTSKWLLSGMGEIRAFRIADEICQVIDQKPFMGIGESEVTNFRIFKVGKSYSGITLWVEIHSSTTKGLR